MQTPKDKIPPPQKKRNYFTVFKIGFGLAFGLQPFEVLRT